MQVRHRRAGGVFAGVVRASAFALGLAAALGPAHGAEPAGRQLAQAKQCVQCHAAAQDTIGPSFETIRATYRHMEGREAALVGVIRDGSAAHLGPLRGHARMPDGSERPPVSAAEARQLARWILRGDLR